MWRRGLNPWMRRDLSFEEQVRESERRRERDATEPSPARYRTVYELVDDDVLDPFARWFLSEYLVRLGNCEHASRLGFVMDSWSKRNGKCPKEITRFLSVHEPFDHVELKLSYLRNARLATANGCYGIRGLTLKWDTAIWSLFREIDCVAYANPFLVPNAVRFSGILASLQYRPEASAVSKAVCRATTGVQYAVTVLYGYDRYGSIPRYLRSLVQELIDVNSRIRHLSLTPDPRIPAEEVRLIQGILPERVAAALGVPEKNELLLSDEFYERVEAAVEVMYDQLCECAECGTRRSEKVAAVRARSIGDERGLTTRRGMLGKKRRNRFFEENVVGLAFCPELGRIRLPRIRHLDLVQQEMLCRHIKNDLMFDSIFGAFRGMSRMRGIPIPFCSVPNLNLDLAYALYLASNSYFLCFLIKNVRDVMRFEERAYRELAVGLVGEVARTLRRDIEARVAAGAESPVRTSVDVRDPGLSAEERDLSVARALEGLTFEGYDVVERQEPFANEPAVQKIGGFCRDAATYLDAVEALRVPKALREHRARADLLVHTLGIRRVYEGRVLGEYRGEQLVPYHLLVSGNWRRDARAIRAHNVNLLDEEIVDVRRDSEMLHEGHVDFYEGFEELGIVREIPIKRRTFMMELQKMYVSKSHLAEFAAAAVAGLDGDGRPDGGDGDDERGDGDYDGYDDDEEDDDGAGARAEMGDGVLPEDYDENVEEIIELDDDPDAGRFEDDDGMWSDAGDGDEDSPDDSRYVVERLDGYRT